MLVHSGGRHLLSLLLKAANEVGIHTFIMWGSLLGYVRDGGIIPHDSDIDLNMFESDMHKIDALKHRLDELGLTVEYRTPYQIVITFYGYKSFGIDLWIFYEDGRNYTLCSMRSKGGIYRYDLPRDLFQRMNTVVFEGVEVNAPQAAEEILSLSYGDWRNRRQNHSDDVSPCTTILANYPPKTHSLGEGISYTKWGAPLSPWPPFSFPPIGSRAPDVNATTSIGEQFSFDGTAGRYTLLGFYGSLAIEESRNSLRQAHNYLSGLSITNIAIVAISLDAKDSNREDFQIFSSTISFIFDGNQSFSRDYGLMPNIVVDDHRYPFRPAWVLIGPDRKVLSRYQMSETDIIIEVIQKIAKPGTYRIPSPALVFQNLINKSVLNELLCCFPDCERSLFTIYDEKLMLYLRDALAEVSKELLRLYFFKPAWNDQFVVSKIGDHRQPPRHAGRHNDKPLSAHRRFSILISLNEDYSGGEDIFPEYDEEGIRVQEGCAVVFPCAALHRVARVTSGHRMICNSYLFDDEGEAIRRANLRTYGARKR